MDEQNQNYHYFSEGATVMYQRRGLDNGMFLMPDWSLNKAMMGWGRNGVP